MPQGDDLPKLESPRIECAQIYGGTDALQIDVELPGLKGVLYSQPCQSPNGGDIHYLSICGSGLLSRFCLADVVGHGSDVAIVSAETHAMLRKSVNWTDHRRVLYQLNGALVAKGLKSLTTAAMCSYFPPTRSLSFSYAGHPPAWRYAAKDRDWEPLELPDIPEKATGVTNIPLAIDGSAQYTRGRLRAALGDLIVVTTDGVADALDKSSRRFGEAGLEAALRSFESPTPRSVVNGITQRLLSYCGVDRFSHDDVTILALRTVKVARMAAIRTMLTNRLVRPLMHRSVARHH
jgi:serine phosphatase RsbU (regulator of sigma subunit)